MSQLRSSNTVRLSKTLSHALRHAPDAYGLTLDPEGWVPTADLLAALARKERSWQNLIEDDLIRMDASAAKQRFEFRDGRIRARYGHSIAKSVEYEPMEPPPVLYHGTSMRALPDISESGLRPMRRQYVHLSADREAAAAIGRRHGGRTAILEIEARAAYAAGIHFYRPGEGTWLCDALPVAFIRFPAVQE